MKSTVHMMVFSNIYGVSRREYKGAMRLTKFRYVLIRVKLNQVLSSARQKIIQIQ